MLTYLPLSKGTKANGDHSCPVQRCFEEFTSHQLDLRRPTVHANLALKSERSERVTPGHLWSSAYYLESSKPTHLLYSLLSLFSCCDPTEWQHVPATRVTLLLPGKECEKRQEVSQSNMTSPANKNHTTQTKNVCGGLTKSHYDPRCWPQFTT